LILSNLLPGLRDVRTPFTVGALWLLFGWLVWPRSHDIPNQKVLTERLQDLHGLLGPGVTLASVSFLAYVLGACATIPTEKGGVTGLLRKVRGKSETDRAYEALIESSFLYAGEHISESDSLSADDLDQAKGAGNQELRALLLVANQEVFGEYDRLAAEASFRLNLPVPMLALGVWTACTLQWWILPPVLAGALILAYQGATRLRDSNRVLRRSVVNGLIQHPMKSIADSLRDHYEQRSQAARNLNAWGAATFEDFRNIAGKAGVEAKWEWWISNRNSDAPLRIVSSRSRLRLLDENGVLIQKNPIWEDDQPEAGPIMLLEPGETIHGENGIDTTLNALAERGRSRLAVEIFVEFVDSRGQRWYREFDGKISTAPFS
jgi:hypothetical protein